MYARTTNTNYTEEAFLLSSLQEVVKVWARGFGEAQFDLKICDGVADLSLNFKLGHPSDQHIEPVHQPPDPHHHAHHEDFENGQETHRPPHQRQRRGPAQRERNRLRAARHRAGTAASAVILPFTGNILPLKETRTPFPSLPKDVPQKQAADPAAPSTASTASPLTVSKTAPATAATAVSPAPPGSGPSTVTRPVKPSKASQAASDVAFVRKQLFPASLQPAPTIPAPGKKKCYKMKEDDLWTKLFSI